MPNCPLCKKPLQGNERECPTCRADVSLLADYTATVREGLARAEALIRAGELAEAVWAYLTILEADPVNPIARRQIGRVATAVRQFDHAAARRGRPRRFLLVIAPLLILAAALLIGFVLGKWSSAHAPILWDAVGDWPPAREAVPLAPIRKKGE